MTGGGVKGKALLHFQATLWQNGCPATVLGAVAAVLFGDAGECRPNGPLGRDQTPAGTARFPLLAGARDVAATEAGFREADVAEYGSKLACLKFERGGGNGSLVNEHITRSLATSLGQKSGSMWPKT